MSMKSFFNELIQVLLRPDDIWTTKSSCDICHKKTKSDFEEMIWTYEEYVCCDSQYCEKQIYKKYEDGEVSRYV